jgi:hypothetical protein
VAATIAAMESAATAESARRAEETEPAAKSWATKPWEVKSGAAGPDSGGRA